LRRVEVLAVPANVGAYGCIAHGSNQHWFGS